jgi:hypothetical protein
MGTFAGILALINAGEPLLANVIVAIRHSSGATSFVFYLDEADPQFAANTKQVSDWLAAHGKKPIA